MILHPKIEALRKLEQPINYCRMGKVTSDGKKMIDTRVVKGYGLMHDSKNSYGEKFLKGAFDKSISDNGPKSNASYQLKFRDRHGKAMALFNNIGHDDAGLAFETKPLDRVTGSDDLLTQLDSGTINNFSIGFRHIWDKTEYDDETDTIICKEAILHEISAVDIPADKGTYAIRTQEDIDSITDDVEEFIINSLPRKVQLEARRLFTRCMTLGSSEPLEEFRQALKDRNKPSDVELDFDYLISKL